MASQISYIKTCFSYSNFQKNIDSSPAKVASIATVGISMVTTGVLSHFEIITGWNALSTWALIGIGSFITVAYPLASSRESITSIPEISLENDSLQSSHEKLGKMARFIKTQLTSPKKFNEVGAKWGLHVENAATQCQDKWKRPYFIEEVSYFMENAALEVEIFFNQLQKEGKNDPETMADLMTDQKRKKGDPDYCFSYFYESLTDMYHIARNCRAYVEFNKSLRAIAPDPIVDEYQNLFFTERTPQYRWRTLYNNFCDKIDDLKLRDALDKKDKRFTGWAIADNTKIENGMFGSKSGKPT